MSFENPTFKNQNTASPEDVVKKIKEEAERERASVTSKRAAEKILEEAATQQTKDKVTFNEYGEIRGIDKSSLSVSVRQKRKKCEPKFQMIS